MGHVLNRGGRCCVLGLVPRHCLLFVKRSILSGSMGERTPQRVRCVPAAGTRFLMCCQT